MPLSVSYPEPADERPNDSAYLQIKLDLALAARRWRRRSENRRDGSMDCRATGIALPAREQIEDQPVSIDQLVRSLLALGATRRDIALEIVRHT